MPICPNQGTAVFGGEYAGHYVFNDGRGFGYDDGLYAALRVMEYLTQSNAQSLSELLSIYPNDIVPKIPISVRMRSILNRF